MAQIRRLPTKAFEINARWTALEPVLGWRHYRISGRRNVADGADSRATLEIELMAVCDRSIRFWLRRRDLVAELNWQTGWIDGAP